MERTDASVKDQQSDRNSLVRNPQFWSVVIVFILITLHHYEDQTSFRLFSLPDLELGVTRHTIDRMLYLVPITLSSFIFGLRGGLITVAVAFLTMLPRAVFISAYPMTALWETLVVTLIGSLAPLGLERYKQQEEQLEVTKEQLEYLSCEREDATRRLTLTEQRYRQLFESAYDAIWLQDLPGKIIAANQAAAELFGYELSRLIGADSRSLFSHEGFVSPEELQERLLEKRKKQYPYKQEIIRADGTLAYVMLTANLVSSNDHPDAIQFIGRDITKEVRMQENQRFYLKQITRAHEEERQRISRDLHDSTAQHLIGVLRILETLCEEGSELSAARLEVLWDLHRQVKTALQEIRQLSRDLRPLVIDDLGFLPAVEWLTEQLRKEHNIDANLTILGEARRFSSEIELTIFRIVQEALRNTVRHAGATKAQVTIAFKDNETRVTVIDNGKGFELPSSLGELSRLGKLGVDGMQTRTRLVGGTFDVYTEPEKGTTITVSIPA